jgi:PKD repeat protein
MKKLIVVFLALTLLLGIQPNLKKTLGIITSYYSTESIVLNGIEITNHTLSHASDDEWYQVSSENMGLFEALSLVLVFSTNQAPSTLTQIQVFIEAHVEFEVSPNTVVKIYNFQEGRWVNLFYITNTTDTQYTWSILANAPSFMNETGHVKLNFFYYHFYPQTLFQDLTYITILATKPKASFFYNPSIVLANQTIFFNASSSYDPDGYIISYDWNFGDGNNASGMVVTHSYKSLGNYTVTLTVTDNDGQEGNISKTIWVRKPPIARFFYFPHNPALNQTVTFNASESTPDGGEIIAYIWNFGDGTNGTGMLTTHKYYTGGSLTIFLTILDSEGLNASTSAVITIVVHDIAIYSLEYSPLEVYRGMNFTIVLGVKNEGTAYETFNATAYYGSDSIALETKTVVNLAPNAVENLTYLWDTKNIIYYINYQIAAKIDKVPGEIDTADNVAESGAVYVRMIGDTNDDGIVDPLDLGFLGAKWGAFREEPRYDWRADFNGDGRVDQVDLGLLGSHWGRTKWDDSAKTVIHHVSIDTTVFEIITLSNSTVTNMTLNQSLKQLSFCVTGPSVTTGYCEVTFPQILLGGPYTVTIDGMETNLWLLASNVTHITVKLFYSQSTHIVAITGANIYPYVAAGGASTLPLLFIGDK